MKKAAILLVTSCRRCENGRPLIFCRYPLLSFLFCCTSSWSSFLLLCTQPHQSAFLQVLFFSWLMLHQGLIFPTIIQFMDFQVRSHLPTHVFIFCPSTNWNLCHFLELWVPFRIFLKFVSQLPESLIFIGCEYFPLPADSINLVSVLCLPFILISFIGQVPLSNPWWLFLNFQERLWLLFLFGRKEVKVEFYLAYFRGKWYMVMFSAFKSFYNFSWIYTASPTRLSRFLIMKSMSGDCS